VTIRPPLAVDYGAHLHVVRAFVDVGLVAPDVARSAAAAPLRDAMGRPR
jgi:hypothetical protein